MPVGSHKDTFKAHQLVKKLIKKQPNGVLAKLAADILLDFVKNQRQINNDAAPVDLPPEKADYEQESLDKALVAVDGLCGKCEEAHDDACFVNQARRILIAARTGVDLGSSFDGMKTLASLIDKATELAKDKAPVVTGEKSEEVALCGDLLSEQERSELEALREQDVFRGTLIDEVVNTIQSVTEGNYATEMPVHDDEQLGKLATAFNLMLNTINKAMTDLDALVAARTEEIKQIMNTVPVGLLSIDKDGRVKPEHSLSATSILNQEVIRGRDFLDLVGLTRRHEDERKQAEDFFEIVRMGLLSSDDLEPLNPFPEIELKEGDKSCWLRLRYYPVERNGEPSGDILVELEDVTEAKRLESEVAASQKENMQLKAIAEDPDTFREFLGETMKIQKELHVSLESLEKAENWLELIHNMFRGVHTIKGAAGSFGLQDLAAVSAELENDLSKARNATVLEKEFVQGISEALERLDETITKACEIAAPIIGEELSSDGPSVRLPLTVLRELSAMAADSQGLGALQKKLKDLQSIPAHRALTRSTKIIPDLIKRLNKEIDFVFQGRDVLIDYETGHALNGPLVHLLRNACDHGVDSAEERQNAGKPEKATVTLSVENNDAGLNITIRDDGRGMDSAKLLASALRKQIISDSEAVSLDEKEKLKLVFRPGFSTAETVSDISGRGVGLDAVQNTIRQELGGEVDIDSRLGLGTAFVLKIPN